MAGTAPRRPTVIQYFRTGLYTRRSALFAPLRVIGIQVVQLNDALIDGQDMELVDTYQLVRRPGFSRFCSAQLAGGEIINQFYGHRNSAGTVFPLFDSNQRVAQFSSSSIITLWSKGSSTQAFTQMIQNQLYICNGTANGQKRYDTVGPALHGIGIAAPAAALTVTPPTGAGSTFWQPNISFPAAFHVLMDPNGNMEADNGTGGVTGPQLPTWSTVFGAITSEISPGSEAWQNLGAPGSWAASTSFTLDKPKFIIDSNGNFQELTVEGTSGASQPAWNASVGGTTADNTITWTNRGSGKQSVFSGYLYMYVYSTQAPTTAGGYYHRSDGSPVTITTGPAFGTYSPTLSGAFSTNTDVGSVDIYRTKDGGSTFYYLGSVVNNTGGGTWTFTDNIADSALNTSLIIPLGTTLLNDPPPGSTGTHSPSGDAIGYITEWQGRFWAVSGSKVYFTSGPDVDNGDPYACWPPANVFTFPGPVQALTPAGNNLMLVWLPDAVKIIAGGPQTLSYYSDDLLDDFGISSPNCVVQDGQTITALVTTGQVFQLSRENKVEISAFIGDLVKNFPVSSSYVTNYRNGLDNGLFLGDGSTNILRYGLNVQAWSPTYKPVGGIKALNAVETSVGTYTLCAGRATAAGYILGRDTTSVQDDGSNYSACFATIGNIVLSQPLEPLVPVYYVAGYFAAGGKLPTVSVMPNEITSSSGPGFVTLSDVQDEPEMGATPSQTLMAKRWNMYGMPSMNNSLLMHHLQVKIAFPQENFASTIFGLALKHEQDG